MIDLPCGDMLAANLEYREEDAAHQSQALANNLHAEQVSGQLQV